MSRLLLASLLALSFASPALAQDDACYRLEKSGERFVRMDTRTGAMTICEDRAGELSCRAASDGDAASELEKRIAALETRLAALEQRPAPAPGLSSEEEFEQTLGFMERFFRRFIGIAKEMEREEKPAESTTPSQRM